ncbi:MAG: ABC transporter ATP-binding protein, partial [Arcobacteraceae bacterium]
IDSIDALTTAIKAFKGSCIIVTHSEELLKAVCDKLIIFRDDKADYFNGTYNEFLEQIGWEDDNINEPKKVEKPKRNKKEIKQLRAAIVAEKSQATKPIKTEIEEIEALPQAAQAKQQSRLTQLQNELEKLNVEFQKKLDEV